MNRTTVCFLTPRCPLNSRTRASAATPSVSLAALRSLTLAEIWLICSRIYLVTHAFRASVLRASICPPAPSVVPAAPILRRRSPTVISRPVRCTQLTRRRATCHRARMSLTLVLARLSRSVSILATQCDSNKINYLIHLFSF